MRSIKVPRAIYAKVARLEKGESIEVELHLHVSSTGRHEVTTPSGAKPLRCSIQKLAGGGRRSTKTRSIKASVTKL